MRPPRNDHVLQAYLVGLGQFGIFRMKDYSIARIGSEYVVLAGEQRVLKLASRRKAAKLVVDAAELLSEQSHPAPDQGRAADQSPVNSAKFLDDFGRFP
jgi:hypothetical protein